MAEEAQGPNLGVATRMPENPLAGSSYVGNAVLRNCKRRSLESWRKLMTAKGGD